MRKTILMAIGTLVLAAPLCAQADHPHRATRTLTDNDDGQVEVWRRGDDIRMSAGAPAIRQPLLHILFVGSGWQPAMKEALTAHLRGTAMPDGVRPAAIAGTNELAAPVALNDLHVQSLIDRAMRDGTLASRDENVVYVVFLAHGVQSTLGANRAADDYDSYHSHFQGHDMNVRYVVVPWNEDPALVSEAAAKSMLRAVVNPDGN